MYISDFEILDAPFIVPQAAGLKWLASAHARNSSDIQPESMLQILQRCGCGPDKINQRSTFLSDFTHQNWNEMQIFSEREGASVQSRQVFFQDTLLEPLRKFYEAKRNDFQNWIHVSCTGYVSPSVVQSMISFRGWGESVQALHAYHMGCYAALSALRMARGNLDSEILHTELCTLHLDVNNHSLEQLVIQSLFADGVIRYRATERAPSAGYKVEDLNEVIAKDSLRHMSWAIADRGFSMTLAREVPQLIKEVVVSIVKPWCSEKTHFAIHPGGPRIIDAVKDALGLSEEQVHFSREVLRNHGNMSSATLPHVWKKMISELPVGASVISMAFGPGLTIATSRMHKV